jgi:tRNA pseudouridine38-40 synthase
LKRRILQKKGNIFEFHFVGEGFMHGQVRMIVGALLATNEGKITKEDIENYLNLKERTIINYKSPAKGLYLEYVGY